MSSTWICNFCTNINNNKANEKTCATCTLPRVARKKATKIVKKPAITIVIDDDEWVCLACTFRNNSCSELCEVCLTPKETKRKKTSHESKRGELFLNYECYLCETLLPTCKLLKEHLELHKEQESVYVDITSKSRDPNNKVNVRSKSKFGDYYAQYETVLGQQYEQGFISFQILEQTMIQLKNSHNKEDEDTRKTGILPLLRKFDHASRGVQEYFLSGDVDHYQTSIGDDGWGCGYRNIQMLSSYLLKFSHLKRLLFGGCGFIPTVPKLQEWLEHAWKAGFDPQGHLELGNLVSSRKWIGTTECAALLRYFGLCAKIVDFVSSPDPSRRRYFPNKSLVNWLWSYFQKQTRKNSGSFVAPVYLQHQGHSRTVVGMEKRRNEINVILFDPSADGNYLYEEAKKGHIICFRKDLSHFREPKYQVVYIEDCNPIPSDKIDQWKKIESVVLRD